MSDSRIEIEVDLVDDMNSGEPIQLKVGATKYVMTLSHAQTLVRMLEESIFYAEEWECWRGSDNCN